MKSKKLTTYVLMVSRTFPNYHPRKGQETHFPHLIQQAVDNHGRAKIHTIRGNYDLWKKRIDKVNEGKAVLSLRYWSGKPYHSEQIEFLQLTKAGIQGIRMDYDYLYTVLVDGKPLGNVGAIAGNDGLSFNDFEHWFCKADLSKPMAIIHFTDFRY